MKRPMLKFRRHQLFVDPKVQGALMLRTVIYWLFCLFTLVLMLVAWRMLTGPAQPFAAHLSDTWKNYWPAMVASFFLLPVLVIDSVQLSNHFAGPMFRLRRAMKQLADGEPVTAVHFREDDYWREFAEDFNRVAARVERLERFSDANVAEPLEQAVEARS